MAGVICYNMPTERIKDMMSALVHPEPDGSNYIEVTDYSIPAMKELVLSLAAASEDSEKLIYFPNAEQIESRTQDVLLKSIEDRDDLCFLFKTDKKMIPTVESRCRIFYGTRLSEEEYVSWLKKEKNLSESDRWLYWFTNGDKELTEEVIKDGSLMMLLRKFDKEQQLTDKKSLLKTFSLLKEKDEKAFFNVYREYVPCLYRLIEHMLFDRLIDGEDEKRTTEALTVLQKHMKMEQSRTYTVADMVDCMLGL